MKTWLVALLLVPTLSSAMEIVAGGGGRAMETPVVAGGGGRARESVAGGGGRVRLIEPIGFGGQQAVSLTPTPLKVTPLRTMTLTCNARKNSADSPDSLPAGTELTIKSFYRTSPYATIISTDEIDIDCGVVENSVQQHINVRAASRREIQSSRNFELVLEGADEPKDVPERHVDTLDDQNDPRALRGN